MGEKNIQSFGIFYPWTWVCNCWGGKAEREESDGLKFRGAKYLGIQILFGYFNKSIQCGLHFLLDFQKFPAFFTSPVGTSENCIAWTYNSLMFILSVTISVPWQFEHSHFHCNTILSINLHERKIVLVKLWSIKFTNFNASDTY